MSHTGTSTWFPGLTQLINPNLWRNNKEKRGRDLREQIKKLSASHVLDEAGIDDVQVLTLTREDLNELFPGVKNFQLRRKIMELIINAAKESLQPGPETFANALKRLMQHNNSGDAAAQDILRECLRAFREVDDQLKAAQASLKPYIEVLNGLGEASVNKERWGIEAASHSRQHPHYDQTNSIPQSTQSSFEPSVKVHSVVCGRTFGADQQILNQLKGVKLTDMTDCQLILVFCPVASRVGTDIEEALRGIPGNKPTVLIVMHHTHNPHHVGPSSTSIPVNVLDYVHVLFHDTAGGLLQCLANNSAISRIQSALKQHTNSW
ncbi:uncharacterized protein si:ch211-245h14.1 [Triplophysa dalaica]|uniref:uncharacterized protein si:ch211-245h14.1 n=1 Tax=Triplophysa dalaica TaxID=1582913 RepID=UPI0024E00CBA|nr:uncharacterized protein si:ch211-245h14.1 [Triplophysa dalaica]